MPQRHQLYGAAIFLLLSGPIYAQTELIGGDMRFHGTVESLLYSQIKMIKFGILND
ncbi:hypothetical protein [Hafnia paralvei]|uniref:hypothetical protein n=1 Tax=Hafnia paralvei TaxID=546367 RepID=UPI001D0FAC2C|nr:hypothetical protein [Hafnia paralvei]